MGCIQQLHYIGGCFQNITINHAKISQGVKEMEIEVKNCKAHKSHGLGYDCGISSALAIEIPKSGTKPLKQTKL